MDKWAHLKAGLDHAVAQDDRELVLDEVLDKGGRVIGIAAGIVRHLAVKVVDVTEAVVVEGRGAK